MQLTVKRQYKVGLLVSETTALPTVPQPLLELKLRSHWSILRSKLLRFVIDTLSDFVYEKTKAFISISQSCYVSDKQKYLIFNETS